MASRRKLRLNLSSVFFTMAAIGLLLFIPHVYAQDAGPQDGPLTSSTDVARVHLIGNDDIVRMAKAGLGDDVLLQTIRLQPGHYDTNPDDLISLKKAGLSDPVIAAMQAHGTGLNVRSRPMPVTPAPTPLAMGIDEIGVYYKSPAGKDGKQPGEWIPLHTERVTFKSGGTVKSLLTHGIVSRDMNGHIDGAKSDLVLPTGVEILIYAPEGTEGTEYDFLRFREHSDNREFRTLTGGVFHSESGAERDEIEFKPKKIAPQMFTFTVPIDIEKGEYGVLPPASAGLQGTGKIFTFSIRE